MSVDGGGSTCRACVADANGNVLGRAVGNSANITSDFQNSLENINDTVTAAYVDAGLSPDRMVADIAYLGLADAGIGDAAARLERSLKFKRAKVVTDRETTVHGALGGQDGTVALFGAGSFYSCRRQGEIRNIGGWGFKLCDDGGGAYLGINLLRRTVKAYDGLIDHSPLTQRILDRFGGTPHAIVSFAQTATPKELGKLAPDLLDAYGQGDGVAEDLIGSSVAQLHRTLDMLNAKSTGALCMLGGLGPFYESQLDPVYKSLCRPPVGDALKGGLSLARAELFEAAQ